jgi:hypothetical protein
MSRHHIWTCDRCKAEAEADDGGAMRSVPPEGWASADIRFHGIAKLGHNQLITVLDLCERCQDDLKRVWTSG